MYYYKITKMIEGVKFTKIAKFSDDRGWLGEIFRNDEIDYNPVMAYMSVTKPGVIRGPHEHEKQSDFFVFAGPGDFELHLWDRREESPTKGEYMKETVGESNPVSVLVPPGVVHGYKCVSKADALSINLPDKLYKGERKKEKVDEIRWEKDPESPYKIL
jgi:dTDP-4-dehydrorhamnose 3,5-epimerase